MKAPLLVATTLAVFVFSSVAGNGQTETEDYCEFEVPLLSSDYWPLLPEDPTLDKERGLPVIDVFIDKEGVPIRFALVNRKYEDWKEFFVLTVQNLRFTPAYACGEPSEGFHRYPVANYFFLSKEEQRRLNQIPHPTFAVTHDLLIELEEASKFIDQDTVELDFTIAPNGSVLKIKGRDAFGRQLEGAVFSSIAPALKFLPPLEDGKPTTAKIRLRLGFTDMQQKMDFSGYLESGNRPLPRKHAGADSRTSKSLKICLQFDNQGVVRNMMFLDLFSAEEATAAIAAFRLWTIEPSQGDRTRYLEVSYGFTDSSEVAVLLEEPRQIVVELPRRVHGETPSYPKYLARQGKRGLVVVSFVVDKEGEVCGTEVLRSTHPDLTASALKVLPTW